MLALFSILVTISALFGYINHKWLKLPSTIGVMLISVLLGITMKVVELCQPELISPTRTFLMKFDFSSFVLDFILSFLLFAGSLHVNITELRGARGTVLSYASIGVLISTFIIGFTTYFLSTWFGFHLGLLQCLLFGALISPTDPIAVIGILSKYNVPKKLKTEIVGESLFNDGVGVVVFTVLLSIVHGGEEALSFSAISKIFASEVIGGLAIGFLIGYAGYFLMKSIDHYQTEVLVTLSVVTGGYTIASMVHASGPLAMVIAGLIIGNKGKAKAMSDITAEYVDKFWELIDEICNTVLFVMMGLMIFLVPFNGIDIIIGCILIVVSLAARFLSLLPAFYLFNGKGSSKLLDLSVLTWGGLRGGISIALVLSLTKAFPESEVFTVSTYCIVLFSILVQGLSIKKLLARY